MLVWLDGRKQEAPVLQGGLLEIKGWLRGHATNYALARRHTIIRPIDRSSARDNSRYRALTLQQARFWSATEARTIAAGHRPREIEAAGA